MGGVPGTAAKDLRALLHALRKYASYTQPWYGLQRGAIPEVPSTADNSPGCPIRSFTDWSPQPVVVILRPIVPQWRWANGEESTRIAVSAAALLVSSVWAQQNVGIGTNTPHPTALLELYSTSKGLLIPRMTQAERDAISFLGTTDAQPLVIRVGNQETFRFNPPGASAPAWSIQRGGGDPRGLHAVDLQSARSAATQVASGDYSVIGGGRRNTASGYAATVGGGEDNTASGTYATVGGGWNNTASSYSATVSGGYQNTASGLTATVGGGRNNTASGQYATVGGGILNTASGPHATVGGGLGNTASGEYSAIPGGHRLQVGPRSFGFSGQTSLTQTDLSANSNIAAFVDVDLWLYSRDRTQASQLRFYEAQAHGSGAKYVALQAPNVA
jgi:hypothetical protein